MTTIYGECVGAGAHAAVKISHLARDGCRLLLDAPVEAPEGELALWIGAIGPFEITARRAGSRSVTARFKRPLEPAIIAHFNA